jgi:hypothetical protein
VFPFSSYFSTDIGRKLDYFYDALLLYREKSGFLFEDIELLDIKLEDLLDKTLNL